MSKELNAVEWLEHNLSIVQSEIQAGKELGLNGGRLDRYLFEKFSRLMIQANVISTSLPTTVFEFTQVRKQAHIEFPRGRTSGRVLDSVLVKAGDGEAREFLASLPDTMKQVAYRKAEKEASRLIEAIEQILQIFPDLDKRVSREELALAFACALGGESRHDLISRFTLRILRKANLDMCEQVARTSLID